MAWLSGTVRSPQKLVGWVRSLDGSYQNYKTVIAACPDRNLCNCNLKHTDFFALSYINDI